MAIFLAIIDLLKTVVLATAWPLAVAIIAIRYKDDISKHLPRVRKAGPTGVELDAAVQERIEITTASGTVELKELPGYARTTAIRTLELEIHRSLEIVDPNHRIDVLAQQLSVSRLSTVFERLYSIIFGSQIAGMRRLREGGTATIEDAKTFFEPHELRFFDFYKDYGFEGWLGFLVNRNLVARNGDHLELTHLGVDFLLYIDASGLNEANKQG